MLFAVFADHPGRVAVDVAVLAGKVRMVAPTVDAATRNGLVYVDLKPGPDSDARPGMFARVK